MATPERNSHCDIETLYLRERLKLNNGIINGKTGRKGEVIRIIKGTRLGYPSQTHAFRGVEVRPPLNQELEKEGIPTEEIFVEDLALRIPGKKYYDNLRIVKKAA